jgi:hypothetical protein
MGERKTTDGNEMLAMVESWGASVGAVHPMLMEEVA